jgi:hypothetical protein
MRGGSRRGCPAAGTLLTLGARSRLGLERRVHDEFLIRDIFRHHGGGNLRKARRYLSAEACKGFKAMDSEILSCAVVAFWTKDILGHPPSGVLAHCASRESARD